MPQYDTDEFLVRHDACGLCFSDVKVIRAGQKHLRIYRDMQAHPVVLGYEVSLTVVSVAHEPVQVEEAKQPSAGALRLNASMISNYGSLALTSTCLQIP